MLQEVAEFGLDEATNDFPLKRCIDGFSDPCRAGSMPDACYDFLMTHGPGWAMKPLKRLMDRFMPNLGFPGMGVAGDRDRISGGAANAERLRRHLDYSSTHGQKGVRELENGRIRYYEELDPARTPGEMAGRRYVHEYDPASGNSRGWNETLDHAGNIRQVRPQLAGNEKIHYVFDTNGLYLGKR